MRWWVAAMVVLGTASCRFRVDGAHDLGIGGDSDAAVGDPDLSGVADLASPADLTQADLSLVSGILSGVRADTPSTTNLSTEGVLDWVHVGLGSTADVNRKFGGPTAITVSSVGTLHQWPYYVPSLSWTSGSPTSSATTTAGLYVDNVNSSFTISVPADTTTRTLRVYFSQYQSTATLVARLSDGAAPNYTSSQTAAGNVYHRYALTFRASHPAQTLTVSWTLTNDAGGGSVDFMAATYY